MPLEDRIVSTFLELAAIDSESYHERAISEHLSSIASRLGLEHFSDNAGEELGSEAGNLYIRVPARGADVPPLCLSAHMDTVEPGRGVVPVVRDGVIRSSGDTILGADCKAGIAVILELLFCSSEGGLRHGPLEILFSVAEEQGLQGIRHMDASQILSRHALVLDGSGPVGRAVKASPTQDNLILTIIGKAAHAGVEPEAGINAIQAASRAIAGMTLGRIDEQTTANIGTIEGGVAVNIVPELVRVQGEVRSHDPGKLRSQMESMVAAAQRACDRSGAIMEHAIRRAYDGYRIPEDEPLLLLAERAARASGLAFAAVATGGGSDANFLNRLGLTALVLNMGARNCHTLSEYVEVAEMVKLADWLAAILEMQAAGPEI